MGRQLGNGPDTRAQIGNGKHLCLVKNYHAAGDVVELAALGRAAGVQRLKKLHSSGHHYRHIPVFRSLSQTDGVGVGFLFQIVK